MDIENIDIVGERGQVLRQALKSDAHKNGWLHKIVVGYLRKDGNWKLVRQAPHKQDAGQLVAPVGGHVKAGESEFGALLRESEEEIGTKNIGYKLIGRDTFRRRVLGRDENHMFVVYEITTDDEVALGDESESLEEFTSDELKQALQKYPNKFGDGFYFVLESFYPDYLPSTWKPRWH
jgi:8-oxo-dGTP pyrophosphatase MutT (NUDIX family)